VILSVSPAHEVCSALYLQQLPALVLHVRMRQQQAASKPWQHATGSCMHVFTATAVVVLLAALQASCIDGRQATHKPVRTRHHGVLQTAQLARIYTLQLMTSAPVVVFPAAELFTGCLPQHWSTVSAQTMTDIAASDTAARERQLVPAATYAQVAAAVAANRSRPTTVSSAGSSNQSRQQPAVPSAALPPGISLPAVTAPAAAQQPLLLPAHRAQPQPSQRPQLPWARLPLSSQLVLLPGQGLQSGSGLTTLAEGQQLAVVRGPGWPH